VLNGTTPRARAKEYIARTTFRPMSVTKVFSALNALSEALTDDDGSVRMDWRMNEDIKLDAATLKERLLPVGQQVTAVGKYSAERRGLIADGMLSMIQLRPGDAETARRALIKQGSSGFVTGLVLFLISHGILAGAFYASETRYSRVSTPEQQSALRTAVQNHDIEEVRRVIRRGVNPNVRDAHNNTLLHDLRDAEMVKVLTDAGATPNVTNDYEYTPIMMAARMGLTDVVTALIKAGAAPDQPRSDGGTALSDTIEGEHPDTVAVLLADRSHSDIVTEENGNPLPPDGGEPMQTVRAYLAGVHARDVKAMTAAFIPRKSGFFDGTDFDLWHKIRPQAPIFASGFTDGTHATLAIEGATLSNWPITWHYQLIYTSETWRIAREWDTSTRPPAPPPPPPSGSAPAGAEPVERPRGR
jgi:ankyrin repeat protein